MMVAFYYPASKFVALMNSWQGFNVPGYIIYAAPNHKHVSMKAVEILLLRISALICLN